MGASRIRSDMLQNVYGYGEEGNCIRVESAGKELLIFLSGRWILKEKQSWREVEGEGMGNTGGGRRGGLLYKLYTLYRESCRCRYE